MCLPRLIHYEILNTAFARLSPFRKKQMSSGSFKYPEASCCRKRDIIEIEANPVLNQATKGYQTISLGIVITAVEGYC
jgi:hypothetical protein